MRFGRVRILAGARVSALGCGLAILAGCATAEAGERHLRLHDGDALAESDAVSVESEASDSTEVPTVRPQFELHALAGATSRFWSTVEQLRSREIAPQALDGLFDSLINAPKEQIATFDAHYVGSTNRALHGLFSTGFFGLGAEQLAGGAVRDRIYPELQGYEVYTAHVDAGLFTRLARRDEGWEYGLSGTVGGGRQLLVQGAAAELLGPSPVVSSTVLYWGGEAFLGHQTWWSDEVRTHTRLSFRPTEFYADSGTAADNYVYRVISHQTAWRWRAESEWLGTLDAPWPGDTDVGLVLIGGQQPIPVDLLPRTWDSVHDLQPFPAFGSLFGAGATLQFFSPSERYQLRLVGGFFGGYPGAGGQLMLSHFIVTGGTWGLEQTSNYRTVESRIKYLALGVRFAI